MLINHNDVKKKNCDDQYKLKKLSTRVAVVQSVFSEVITNDKHNAKYYLENIKNLLGFEELNQTQVKPNSSIFMTLLSNILSNYVHYDEIIENGIKNHWKLKRIPTILLSILRTATCEIIYYPKLSISLIISEYNKVTHMLCNKIEANIVHSTLNKIGLLLRTTEIKEVQNIGDNYKSKDINNQTPVIPVVFVKNKVLTLNRKDN